MMRFLCALFVILLLPACAQNASRTTPAKSAGATIGYIDGLAVGDSRAEAAPVAVALAAGALNFGLESLKKWAMEEAKNYEVKTSADAQILVNGIEHADPLVHPTLNGGGVLLYLRIIDVPEMTASSYKTLQLDVPANIGSIADQVVATLAHWSLDEASKDAVRTWAEAELKRARDEQKRKEGRARVLSMAAVAVVQPARVQQGFIAGGETGDDRSLQVVLGGYTYPVVQTNKNRIAPSNEATKNVKSMLILALGGPGGNKDPYNMSVEFKLSSDKARDAEPGVWKTYDAGRHPRSKPASIPSFRVLVATGTLVETNDIKKTLEGVAEFIGLVKLSPADVGIEKDD